MTAPLIQLTLEAHKELAREGKVRQVSGPLMIGLESGTPPERIHEGIVYMAASEYIDANAYMIGMQDEVGRGVMTAFVLYEISGQK